MAVARLSAARLSDTTPEKINIPKYTKSAYLDMADENSYKLLQEVILLE